MRTSLTTARDPSFMGGNRLAAGAGSGRFLADMDNAPLVGLGLVRMVAQVHCRASSTVELVGIEQLQHLGGLPGDDLVFLSDARAEWHRRECEAWLIEGADHGAGCVLQRSFQMERAAIRHGGTQERVELWLDNALERLEQPFAVGRHDAGLVCQQRSLER